MEFVQANEAEVMYSGAVRAGKTYSLCAKTYARAARKGAREILCRKTLPALKGTTLKTLLQGDGDNPPVIPPGTYTHNKADKEIRIHNGGEIVYFSLVNDGAEGVQQRAGSYSGTGVNIDEATELDEADYRMLLSRASINIAGVPKQVNMACNPGSPSHFLAKRFATPGSGHSTPLQGCRCISTMTSDNFYLEADYLAMLDRDKGTLWYRRFVLGQWCGAEGLVYDRWDREIHVQTADPDSFKRFIVGVDDGYTNPFVCLLIGIDGDGRMSVCGEVYKSGLLVADRVREVKRLIGGRSVDVVLVDPSSPDLIAEMSNADLPVIPAMNDVVPGINCVQGRLGIQPDKRPRLTVDPCCPNLIREMETYQWKPNKPLDEPVKAHDHAQDALRYATAHLDLNAQPTVMFAEAGTPTTESRRSVMDDRLWQNL